MKKWVWIGFAGVVLLWLVGALWLLPATQTTLEKATLEELAKPDYTGAFGEVKVMFSGQEAYLTGKVGSQQDHDLAGKVVAEKVRVGGSSLNPVSVVHNNTGVEYGLSRQHPKPWLLMARFGGQAVISGIVPPELKDRASQALSAKLSGIALSNQINTKLGSSAKPRPAEDASTSLDAKTVPTLAGDSVAVSGLTGSWTQLAVTASDMDVSAALASANIDSSDIVDALAPLRFWQAAEAEKARQLTLPPAYAGVTALPDALHVYGLVGDDDSQRRLLVALGTAYPKRKMLTSALKVSDSVCNAADWTPAVSSLPRSEGEAFVAALKAGDKPVIWDAKGDLGAMQKALSVVLPAAFAFKDLWDPYNTWKNPPPPPAPTPAPAAAPQIKIQPAAPGGAPAAATPQLKVSPAQVAPQIKIAPGPSAAPAPAAAPQIQLTPPPVPAPPAAAK